MGWFKDMLNDQKKKQQEATRKEVAERREVQSRVNENTQQWQSIIANLIRPKLTELIGDSQGSAYKCEINTPRPHTIQLKVQDPRAQQVFSILYELDALRGVITVSRQRKRETGPQRTTPVGTQRPIDPNLIDQIALKDFDEKQMLSTLKNFAKEMLGL